MNEVQNATPSPVAPQKLPFRPKLALGILMVPVVMFMIDVVLHIVKLMSIWHNDQDLRGGGMLFPAIISYQITAMIISLIICGIFAVPVLLIRRRSKYGRISAMMIGILVCLFALFNLFEGVTAANSDDMVSNLVGGAFFLLLAIPILWATMHAKSKEEFVGG